MARIENIVTTDDLDGTEGASRVVFGLDDERYEVDLSPENEQELRRFLGRYVSAGRRLSRSGRAYTRVDDAAVDTRAVRAWASSRGIDVPARGRISADVIAQFRAAGN